MIYGNYCTLKIKYQDINTDLMDGRGFNALVENIRMVRD
jgi:hypothetical protein